MLYRPFIHYLTPVGKRGAFAKGSQGEVNNVLQARARECLSRARAIVRIGVEMDRFHRVNSGYWHTLYSVFVSTVIIAFCVIMSPDGEDGQELLADVELGGGVLEHISDHSITARKCFAVFSDIHNAMKKGLAKRGLQSGEGMARFFARPDSSRDDGWPMIPKDDAERVLASKTYQKDMAHSQRKYSIRNNNYVSNFQSSEYSIGQDYSPSYATDSSQTFPTYGVQILPFDLKGFNQNTKSQADISSGVESPSVNYEETAHNTSDEAGVFWKHLLSKDQSFTENGGIELDMRSKMLDKDYSNDITDQQPQLFPFPQAGTFTTFPPPSQKQTNFEQVLGAQSSENITSGLEKHTNYKEYLDRGGDWDRQLSTEDKEITDIDWGEFFKQIDQVYVHE